MVNINRNSPESNLISAQVSGKLTGDDYKKLNPLIDEKIRENGKINMLFDFQNFDKISMGSVWQELKFDSKHSDDINKIAIVGDYQSQDNLESLKDSMTSGETRYFEPSQREEAQRWISDGSSAI